MDEALGIVYDYIMKMKQTVYKTLLHWLARITAADPGLTRLVNAVKATLSVISSVLTTNLLLDWLDYSLITVPIFSGIVGLLGVFAVFDDTSQKQKVTTLLLALSSSVTLSIGAWTSSYFHLSDVAILCVVFLAFYLSRYGSRYFSLNMIGFISIYFSTILGVQFGDLPIYFIGIAIGVFYAYFYKFVLLKNKPETILKRSMTSFHVQTNLILTRVIHIVQHPYEDEKELRYLNRNVLKLNEYARNISAQLGDVNPYDVWEGITANQLRLYVFDVQMLMETLTPTIEQLKEHKALDHSSVQDALVQLIQSTRDVKVLRHQHVLEQLREAEKNVQKLRTVTQHVNQKENDEWLFLLRRLNTMANHVIEGAFELHEVRHQNIEQPQEADEEAAEDSTEKEKAKGLEPTTKKALQALLAGSLAIALGYALTPTHQYWILLSAFIVFMGTDTVGRTFIKANDRTIGTIAGAIVGFLVSLFLSGHSTWQVAFIFLCIFMAFYLFNVSYSLAMFWITMIIAMLYDLLLGGITYQLLFARVLDTFLGAYIGFSAAALVFPKKTREKVTDTTIEFLELLSQYIESYLMSLKGKGTTDNLAEIAFDLDQSLHQFKVDSESIRKRPARFSRSDVERWLTILVATNYYAKHLNATRENEPEMDAELKETIDHIQAHVTHNIAAINEMLKSKRHQIIYDLEQDRERIERYPDQNNDLSKRIFVYKLYYIWRINQSLVLLAQDMGAPISKPPE
ncbi:MULTISPECIES: FUSC family protein [Pontibacillus]|uniref:FUSC family protein n=1 Tax=Pontibacillus chungwhensis TaxID=265426 RepID=A0ABY8USR2_9BACI|nr:MULTISPECIES: FUSC family protein [Pontibacillus]MCD5323144.1 FUSC family protein [Pontibacillus sp. HN14]WIF96532.1 FUSC family protein [Pontibacillus chungwhensis]